MKIKTVTATPYRHSVNGLLFSSLLLGLLSLPVMGQGHDQCWRVSSATSQAAINCGTQDKICIEWEEENEDGSTTVVVATSCCTSSDLQFLDCSGVCSSLTRPLATGHVPSPSLPDAGPASKENKPAARPHLPVIFRGETLADDELDQLDGKILHYLFVLDDGTGDSAFYALEDRHQIAEVIAELNRSESPDLAKQVFTAEEGGLSLYADTKWRHANYFLPEGSGVDFKESWWANKVSSLRGTGTPTWVTLFDGEGYSGSSLTLSTGWDRPSLAPFGWDDRARSVYLWPRSKPERFPLKASF